MSLRFFFWNRTSTLATAAPVALALSISISAQQPHGAGSPKSEDTKTQHIEQEKTYSFEDLLNKDPGAVAAAQRRFAIYTDPELKQRLASILLSLGVRDKVYRDYLEHGAREALADETPWPIQYNAKGKRKGWNPQFLQWCRKRGLLPWATFKKACYETPVPWYYLAASGEPSFYDLLIEGLHSHNLMIVSTAAQGLAKLQDPRAIESLIAAGRHTPGEGRAGIGQSLLYFPDPRAQAAADEFLASTGEALGVFRQEAKEKGVKGLFQW